MEQVLRLLMFWLINHIHLGVRWIRAFTPLLLDIGVLWSSVCVVHWVLNLRCRGQSLQSRACVCSLSNNDLAVNTVMHVQINVNEMRNHSFWWHCFLPNKNVLSILWVICSVTYVMFKNKWISCYLLFDCHFDSEDMTFLQINDHNISHLVKYNTCLWIHHIMNISCNVYHFTFDYRQIKHISGLIHFSTPREGLKAYQHSPLIDDLNEND